MYTFFFLASYVYDHILEFSYLQKKIKSSVWLLSVVKKESREDWRSVNFAIEKAHVLMTSVSTKSVAAFCISSFKHRENS